MPKRRHALVIEGGGMKAAYANGVLSAFEEAGYKPFDAVYGTSAGGALAAWFAAEQARYAELTWKYAADRRILSYRRWLRKGTLLDHEALLDIVYIKEMPIDQERILQSPIPVIVTASDVDSGEATYRDLRDGHVIQWIKATGRLPFAAGPAVEIDGRRYLDGGILDAIPIQRAVADGHDLVTLILNKRPGRYKKDNPIIAKIAAARYPKLRHGILRHQEHKNEAMHYARNPPAGVEVRIIRPEVPTHLHRLSRDLSVLEAAIDQGRHDGRRHIENFPETSPDAAISLG